MKTNAEEPSTTGAAPVPQTKAAGDEAKVRKAAPPAPQRPTVGRTVHFYDREEIVEAARREKDPEPSPAIIRRVRDAALGTCDLVVFSDLGTRNYDAVPLTAAPQANAWTWPARV